VAAVGGRVMGHCVVLRLGIVVMAGALPLAVAESVQAAPHSDALAVAPRPAGGPGSMYTSTTFAGYLLQAGGPSTVTATFRVPALHCTAARREIVASAALSGTTQSGNSTQSSASLLLGCYGGKAHLWPVLVVNNNETNYPTAGAQPGDVVTLTADSKLTAGGKAATATVSVADKTRKFTRKLTGTFVTSSHPWIGEGAWFEHNKETAVPDFGSFRYYDCASDGNPMSTKFGWLRYNRVTSKGAVQISTSAIHSAGFTSTFEHS
jgi:hypothetical protein